MLITRLSYPISSMIFTLSRALSTSPSAVTPPYFSTSSFSRDPLVHAYADGDIPFLRRVDYCPDPVCASDIAGIDTDLVCAVFYCRDGKPVIKMNIRHQRDMDLLFDFCQRIRRSHIRNSTADDLASCRLKLQDLFYRSFHVGLFWCSSMDWMRTGFPPPIFLSPICTTFV